MPRPKKNVDTGLSVKEAYSIGQELANAAPADDSINVDATIHEEETFLNRKREEGFRNTKIKNDLLQAQLDKITGDNKARKLHSTLIFAMVMGWLVAVIVILILVGACVLELSDKVLMTLLATTSINVIGLLVIVANYLFNKSKST